MKRYLVLVLISFLSLAMGPNTKTLYSIDGYDGYCNQQKDDVPTTCFFQKGMDTSSTPERVSLSLLTFDVRGVDFSQVKKISISLSEKADGNSLTAYSNFAVVIFPVELEDPYLALWPNIRLHDNDWKPWLVEQFLEPEKDAVSCFSVPFNPDEDGFSILNKNWLTKEWTSKDNLLPFVRRMNGHEYLSFGLWAIPVNKNPVQLISFFDGNESNSAKRPRLIIRY